MIRTTAVFNHMTCILKVLEQQGDLAVRTARLASSAHRENVNDINCVIGIFRALKKRVD